MTNRTYYIKYMTKKAKIIDFKKEQRRRRTFDLIDELKREWRRKFMPKFKNDYEEKLYVLKHSRPENLSITDMQVIAKKSWKLVAYVIAKESQFKSERWYENYE